MKCKTCGKNAESEYCFQHKPRKALAKTKGLSKVVKNASFDSDNRKISNMNAFFLQIWNKRKHCSEVSGAYLGSEPRTIFFHHILPKEKYFEAAYDEDNIILLTFDEHNNVESDIYKYEEVNKRRESLKLKYERIKQRAQE
jgi:hypothetical protein